MAVVNDFLYYQALLQFKIHPFCFCFKKIIYLHCMKNTVPQKVQELINKAAKSTNKSKSIGKSGSISSLHQIIKTKEQAERFIKSLQSAD